jgi:hypothetical protein
MSIIHDFFAELDERWSGENAKLAIIGCGALMLQIEYERGTKDGDVFETIDLTRETQAQLLVLAGPGSAIHVRRKLYIDIVKNGIPFLAHVPRWHRVLPQLRCLEIFALDVVDVVVAKLKRFNANDQSDVDAMIARDLVAHEKLIERFMAAVDEFSGDARAEDLPKYVVNLHRVERDMLGVDETEIELPSWI